VATKSPSGAARKHASPPTHYTFQLTVNGVHHFFFGGRRRRRRPGRLLGLVLGEGIVDAALGPALQRLEFPGAAQRPIEELVLGSDPVLLLFPLPNLLLSTIRQRGEALDRLDDIIATLIFQP
jgi:hypothetical protein